MNIYKKFFFVLKKYLKNFIFKIFSLSVSKFFFSFFRGNGCILMFHRILNQENVSQDRFVQLGITKKDFTKKIKYLSSNYKILSLENFVDHINLKKKHFAITLTFDDGYKDNLTNMLPIINRYKIPVTIFVCVGFINKKSNLWWYQINNILLKRKRISFFFEKVFYSFNLFTDLDKEIFFEFAKKKYFSLKNNLKIKFINAITGSLKQKINFSKHCLSWMELKKLTKNPLITIGAHSVTHPILSALNKEDLKKEILLSKKILEKKLKIKVKFFSYPYGDKVSASHREFDFVRKANYLAAVTTENGHPQNDNLFNLPRQNVGSNITNFELLEAKLSGFRMINYTKLYS